jgi:hypothetical protein
MLNAVSLSLCGFLSLIFLISVFIIKPVPSFVIYN